MKKVLIIYPHFPPSNLAGVHRARLFAMHLPDFGWEPVVLTVHEDYYEEAQDPNLVKLVPAGLRIEKTRAWKVTRPRLIGDIGIRGFTFLYRKALALLKQEQFDFIYIPIPSFYCALLGRRLNRKTGVPYGIDYIDPWVHDFPGSEKVFSRHWFSKKLASFLEPLAVKHAALITGVAAGYYEPVLLRNPVLKNAITGAMPYGGEENDHKMAAALQLKPYLFSKKDEKVQLVYAGAMLPKAYKPLEAIFEAINEHRDLFRDFEIHFIGTGSRVNDPESFNIKPLAEKYGLWQTNVFEYPKRIPYLDVLIHLEQASGIFILGSTEQHYTPSKTYQGVLSEKPLMAVLHERSTAVDVVRQSGAGMVLDFDGEGDVQRISKVFPDFYKNWLQFQKSFSPDKVNRTLFDQFSARNVTRQLAELFEKAILNAK